MVVVKLLRVHIDCRNNDTRVYLFRITTLAQTLIASSWVRCHLVVRYSVQTLV